MKSKQIAPVLIIMVGLLLGACSSPPAGPDQGADMEVMESQNEEIMSEEMPAEDEMMAEDGDDMAMEGKEMDSDAGMGDHQQGMPAEEDNAMDEDAMNEDAMNDDSMASEAMIAPAWFEATLVETRTGEPFTIAGLQGKVILVETMAIWCSNCLKQQGEVKTLHAMLGERDDFISLGIDIDPNENADALRAYINDKDFDWRYSVAPREVAREIGQLYGDQFLNPPSTPMLIIDRHGEGHPLPFGIKGADFLLESLQPFLDADS